MMPRCKEVKNPYYHRGPVEDPKEFFDREEILSHLFEYVTRGEDVSLVGERYIGKTSILYQIMDKNVRAQYLPEIDRSVFVYVNPDLGIAKPQDFYHAVFGSLCSQVPSFAFSEGEEINQRRAREYLRQLRPLHLVLLLDEFQKFTANENFPEDFYSFLSAVADAATWECETSLVTVTPMPLYEICRPEVVGRAASTFFKSFKPEFVGSFTERQFDNFLKKTASPANVPLLDYRRQILDLAGRFPFFLQIACYYYFEAWTKEGPPLDHGVIRQRFMDEAKGHFGVIWNHLDGHEKELVVALAGGERIPQSELQSLEQKGYIVDGNLFSSAFAGFVRQIKVSPLTPGVSFDDSGNVRVVDGKGNKRIMPREDLTPLERGLLRLLYEKKGKVCSYREITDKVWAIIVDPNYKGAPPSFDSIHQTARRLREKIEPKPDNPCFITTVRGEGYKLVDPDSPSAQRIVTAKDPQQMLNIYDQTSLAVVSPFIVHGPVPEHFFFDREPEINQILHNIQHTSVALLGGRRVGKTSILQEVNRRLRSAHRNHRCILVNCEAVREYTDFFEAVTEEIQTQWSEIAKKAAELDPDPQSFRRMVSLLQEEETLPIFLMDEIDGLLKFDQDRSEILFSTFRGLSQTDTCRFVCTGERYLNERRRARTSPLLNFFGVPISLGYLDPQSAMKIIERPMAEIGIKIRDKRVLEKIADLSSCHPRIVQVIGDQLVRVINEDTVRELKLDHFDRVANSETFKQEYISTIWGGDIPEEGSTALERIITLVLDEKPASEREIRQALLQRDVHCTAPELKEALRTLELYSVLKKEGKEYSFVPKHFPRIVKESLDIELTIEGYKDLM